MKKVIVLQGDENTGKTAALKLVVRALLDNNARLLAFSNNFAKWMRGDEVGDIWAMMEYRNEIIFITTRGDYPKCILDDFNSALQMARLDANKIDVFVCAAHTNNQIQKVLNTIGLTVAGNIIINKTKSPTKTSYNSNDKKAATIIFNKI